MLIRGARQVGKSYSVTSFGQQEFTDVVTVNFELQPEMKQCFTNLPPREIIEKITLLSKKDIFPGNTLLFFDEIQECPQAILSLRYFYEQMPQLHVIGAGSLLEFTLASEQFRMPVGRVQYLFMHPLSFGEFLDAVGEDRLREAVQSRDAPKIIDDPLHTHLMSLAKKYMVLGGMPAVLEEFLDTGNMNRCLQIQQLIAQTYRDDFGKYANRIRHRYLEKIFYGVPRMVGRKFKYSHIDPTLQSRDLKQALELLEQAGGLYRVRRTSGEGVPLEANARDNQFKTIFLDIGLMQNMCGLNEQIALADDLLAVNAGALAEQLVGQELIAHHNPFAGPSLYYWGREARNSSAEVDYLITSGPKVIPVEVKSGPAGRMKSMQLFFKKYGPGKGIKFSQAPFDCSHDIINLPLYAVEYLDTLLNRLKTGKGNAL